jgi:ketosteroid isomerase-like protein
MRTVLTAIVLTGVSMAADPPKPEMKAALMAADRAFAKATADKGLDGWVGFMADDVAKVRRPGEKLVVGKDAVRRADAEILADKNRKLVWQPVDAHAFADGNTGVTSGRYKVVGPDKDGKEVVLATGGYVTVWRLERDGAWKVVFDTGSPDPAAPANK